MRIARFFTAHRMLAMLLHDCAGNCFAGIVAFTTNRKVPESQRDILASLFS